MAFCPKPRACMGDPPSVYPAIIVQPCTPHDAVGSIAAEYENVVGVHSPKVKCLRICGGPRRCSVQGASDTLDNWSYTLQRAKGGKSFQDLARYFGAVLRECNRFCMTYFGQITGAVFNHVCK